MQFFPSLNHHFLICILQKVGLDSQVVNFFADYLVSRKTNYIWNNISSPTFEVNIWVGQGSTLSPILLALYLSSFLYILENRLKNLNIPISIISFVDDGLFISQNKLIDISNSHFFCSYNVMSKLLDKFSLIVKHSKTEVFHFNRLHSFSNPSPLDLSTIGGPVLMPKNLWKYLGFIFDRKLSFHQHIDYYSNKAISTVKCMKLLGNSSCSIVLTQKHLLYRCCILPITLYGYQLWFYNHASLLYHMKILWKMQRRAAIWILGAFKTSPVEAIEAIAEIIPIKLHLQKLANQLQLCTLALPPNHLVWTFMNNLSSSLIHQYPALLNNLTSRQRSLIKGHLVDSNNKVYGIFSSFSSLHPEFFPGSRIIDNFPDCFSFNLFNKKEKNDTICFQQLDNLVLELSSSLSTAIVVMDTSIKNDIAPSISYIHLANHPMTKTVHHVMFITSTEAKLFAIRCGINQACNKENISKIIVITDFIYAAKKIFDATSHPYQIHTTAILQELCHFLDHNWVNSIEF